MKNFSKKAAIRTAAYYTVIISLFSMGVLIANQGADSISLEPARILLMMPFCICFAIANTIMSYKEVEATTRWGVHAALTIIGAFVFLILPVEFQNSSSKFMGLIIICIAYIICALIYAAFNIRLRKTIAEDKELRHKKKHR